MRAITALSIASDAIRAAVIADPYTDSPTIKHFQALPLPVGAGWRSGGRRSGHRSTENVGATLQVPA